MKRAFLSMSGAMLLALGASGTSAFASDTGAQRVLDKVEPGMWEVTAPGGKSAAQRLCLRDVSAIAQYVHRGQQCSRVTVSQQGDIVLMRYTCARGGFGTSEIQVVTPRSLRVQTQGIAGNLPFNRTLHARRVGSC